MNTQAAQVSVVCRSVWKFGSAGTTRVCWSTYATQATAKMVSVSCGRRFSAGSMELLGGVERRSAL